MDRHRWSLDEWKAKARAGQPPADAELRKVLTLAGVDPVADEPNTLRIIISTGQQDRERDIIEPAGWELDAYLSNPVVLWAHDYASPPVGRSPRLERSAEALIGLPEFTTQELYPFGHMIGQMLRQGFLNAASVGFAPEEAAYDEELNGVRFRRQSLLEFSIVPVPANAGCLVEARAAGIDVQPLLDWATKTLDTWSDEPQVIIPKRQIESAYFTLRDNQLISIPNQTTPANLKLAEAEAAIQASVPITLPLALTKRGRVLSGRNEREIRDAVTDLQTATTRLSTVLEQIGPANDLPPDDEEDDEDDEERSARRADPIRWNPALSKAFDVASEPLPPSRLEYAWAARFLEVPVAELVESQELIPSARMPSFLTALDESLHGWLVEAVRHISSDGTEGPPIHENIQLNSQESRSFLVAGTRFLRHLEHAVNLIVKLEPSWYGLTLTTFASQEQTGQAKAFIAKTWQRAAQINYLQGEALTLSGEFLTRGDERWGDVFLETSAEQTLQRTVEAINERGAQLDARGILLMGVPGVGKTLSGRIIMNTAQATFIWVSARDFYRAGAFGGLTYAFDLAAECAPSILFIEDVDHWLTEWTIDLLKTEMDGIKRRRGIVTMLTTNFPERLPEALIDRPGRFHDLLELQLPTEAIRLRMLKAWLPDIAKAVQERLAADTPGFSGAHMRELVTFARTLQQENGLTLEGAAEKALEKLREQRRLVDELHGRGKPRRTAHYRPRVLIQRLVAATRKDVAIDVKQEGFEIQTLLFPTSKWTSAEAAQWCRDHDYDDDLDETGEHYRARQREPGAFVRLRTICLAPADTAPDDEACRIKAIGGPLKSLSEGEEKGSTILPPEVALEIHEGEVIEIEDDPDDDLIDISDLTSLREVMIAEIRAGIARARGRLD